MLFHRHRQRNSLLFSSYFIVRIHSFYPYQQQSPAETKVLAEIIIAHNELQFLVFKWMQFFMISFNLLTIYFYVMGYGN